MALNKSLIQSFRKNRLLVGSGWRAYFAPYNKVLGSGKADTTKGPFILDLQTQGPFNDQSGLPTGFFDCGWIKDYAITPQDMVGKVRSGYRGAVRTLYRGQTGEEFTFKFREASKHSFKLATGTTTFNLLKSSTTSTVGPLSGVGGAKPALVAYSAAAPSVTVATGSGAYFTKGDYIVVDRDYDPSEFGILGDNGTFVFQNEVSDVDFLRKTSDYVARVVNVVGDVLTINAPFVGGGSGDPTAPTSPPTGGGGGFRVQKIVGWASRAGGSDVTEWSAVFTQQYEDGGQILFYYPHVGVTQFRNISAWDIENMGTTDTKGNELETVMESMAFDDPLDGQTTVCYRAFYPPPNMDIQFAN